MHHTPLKQREQKTEKQILGVLKQDDPYSKIYVVFFIVVVLLEVM